jgi:hypothetical protein
MKLVRLLIGVVFNIVCLNESYAQRGNPAPCNEIEQIDLDSDSIKRKILVDFVANCEQNEWKNDKGIVLLTE